MENEKRYVRSEETRRRISEALKGKPKSPEHIRKMVEGKRAHRKPLSAEARQKISNAGKGRQLSSKHRQILSDRMLGEKNPMKDPDVLKRQILHRDRGAGKNKNSNGYIVLRGYSDHPNATRHGLVLEHVKVMSDHLARPLTKNETVHHKNGVRDDNRLENLELWSTRHPKGQRVEDKVAFALEILKQYSPHLLSQGVIKCSHSIGESSMH